jgi:hypothetical protein
VKVSRCSNDPRWKLLWNLTSQPETSATRRVSVIVSASPIGEAFTAHKEPKEKGAERPFFFVSILP